MLIILARPRGFCDGVIRAVSTVEQALQLHGAPVYVLHEIVHNRHVVEGLGERGAVFVEAIEKVPSGAVVIFSAHGVPEAVVREAEDRGLLFLDATCPLVKRVHLRARQYSREGREVIIIGHEGHPEVEGTKGWIDGHWHVVANGSAAETLVIHDPAAVSYVTQTTLNSRHTLCVIAVLENRFPSIVGPGLSDICNATQGRQEALNRLAPHVDLLLVVGSRHSSNSNRLREVGEQSGCPSFLIEDAGDIDPSWLGSVRKVGLTAGASAPELLVQGVVERLRELCAASVLEMDTNLEPMSAHAGEAGLSRSSADPATSP